MPTALPLARAVADPGLTIGQVQAVFFGTSQNLAYNASGGASAQAGPFATSVLRLAIGKSSNVRIAVGDSTITATATSAMLVGPGTEYIGITSGQYLAAISDDATTGSLNITTTLP